MNDKQGAGKDESFVREHDSAHFHCPLDVKLSLETHPVSVDQLDISSGIKSCPFEED